MPAPVWSSAVAATSIVPLTVWPGVGVTKLVIGPAACAKVALYGLAVVVEDGGERRERFEEAAPLVDAAHALHEQALGRRLDDVRAVDLAELDLEVALVPDERAVDRLLPHQLAEGGVDHLAVAEED